MELEKIIEIANIAWPAFCITFSACIVYAGIRINKIREYKIKNYFDKYPELLKYVQEKKLNFIVPFSKGFKEADEWLGKYTNNKKCA